MKKIVTTILSVAFICIISSCEKATCLKVDKQKIEFSSRGGSDTITLTSDAKNFSVDDVPSWIETEIKDNCLILSAKRNCTDSDRSGNMSVCAGGIKQNIHIRQALHCTYIQLEKDFVLLSSDGDLKSIAVQTDGDLLNVSAPKEIEAYYSNGYIYVKSERNKSTQVQKGNISISCDNIYANLSYSVQNGLCPTCKGKGYVPCPYCDGTGGYREPYSAPCQYCHPNPDEMEFGYVVDCPDC